MPNLTLPCGVGTEGAQQTTSSKWKSVLCVYVRVRSTIGRWCAIASCQILEHPVGLARPERQSQTNDRWSLEFGVGRYSSCCTSNQGLGCLNIRYSQEANKNKRRTKRRHMLLLFSSASRRQTCQTIIKGWRKERGSGDGSRSGIQPRIVS